VGSVFCEARNFTVNPISDVVPGLALHTPPLSDRQLSILSFVQQYVEQNGHSPSIRDIGRGVGLSSNSNVVYHINRLIERGYLAKATGANRTLVVLDAGLRQINETLDRNWVTELRALRAENQRLREWCRQLERERTWERQQLQAQAG
jgi:SOS-response transcriptional repressor LexA